MPLKSRWRVEIPEVSLQTWVFGTPNEPLRNDRCLTDANRPDTHYLTFSTFRLWAKRVAVGLQKAGLRPGDRVLLFSGNNIFFPVVFMGILMAGGIFTGANPTYVARELAYQLKDSDAKFLIATDGSLDVALDAISQIGMSKDRVFIFDDAGFEGTGKSKHGIKNWNTLLGSVEEADKFIWHDVKDPKDTICCLNYSSGTTGVPKGVMITHYNYVANGELVIYLFNLRPDHEERRKTEQWLCMLPMYHAYGNISSLLNFRPSINSLRSNILHIDQSKDRGTRLHHAKIRLHQNARTHPRFQNHKPDPGPAHSRRPRKTPRSQNPRPKQHPYREFWWCPSKPIYCRRSKQSLGTWSYEFQGASPTPGMITTDTNKPNSKAGA
jgi:AMP-binding enzyme